MNSRMIGGAIGRRSVLLVALAVLFATAGVLYAHWSDTLMVEAQVNTGSIDPIWSVHGTNDDGGPNGWDDEYAWPSEWDNGDGSSADPAGPQGWGRYEKNVARCDAEFFDWGQDQKGLSMWVENAYPSYWCTILADLGNDGTVPVKLQGIEWTVYLNDDQVDGIHQVDPGQIISDGDYQLDPGFFPPETAWFIMEGADYTPAHDLDLIFSNLEFARCGYQLDPGENPEFYIHLHPYQGAVQGANYRIEANFEWVNYNEYRDEYAYGCAW